MSPCRRYTGKSSKSGKVMIRREDLDELVDTIELMSSPERMEMIRKSEEDIRMGRVKEVSTVEDLLNESSP